MTLYSFFAGIGLKLLSNKNRKSQPNVPFHEARHIGILIHWHKEMKVEHLSLFIASLRTDKKEIKLLVYTDKLPEPNPIPEAVWFHKKELSWVGTIANPSVKRFIRTGFDYLYVLSEKPNEAIKFILARSKARTVVGKNIETLNPYQDMIITLDKDSTLETLLRNMYHYSEQLR